MALVPDSSSSFVQDPTLVEDISNPQFLHHAERPRAMLLYKALIGECYICLDLLKQIA